MREKYRYIYLWGATNSHTILLLREEFWHNSTIVRAKLQKQRNKPHFIYNAYFTNKAKYDYFNGFTTTGQ